MAAVMVGAGVMWLRWIWLISFAMEGVLRRSLGPLDAAASRMTTMTASDCCFHCLWLHWRSPRVRAAVFVGRGLRALAGAGGRGAGSQPAGGACVQSRQALSNPWPASRGAPVNLPGAWATSRNKEKNADRIRTQPCTTDHNVSVGQRSNIIAPREWIHEQKAFGT